MKYHYTIELRPDNMYRAAVQNPHNGHIIVAMTGALLRGALAWVREQQKRRGDPIVGLDCGLNEEVKYERRES